MVKPDPILMTGERSEKARATDELQKKLATQQQRLFSMTFWLVVVLEAGLWYWEIDVWIRLIAPLLWIGFLIHSYALLILHELWEINDQLAGRKDELRNLLKKGREFP